MKSMMSMLYKTLHVTLTCEQGHVEQASGLITEIDDEAGTYRFMVGDAWHFTDCCKPCDYSDACLEAEEPCAKCAAGWRSQASVERGQVAIQHEFERVYVGGC